MPRPFVIVTTTRFVVASLCVRVCVTIVSPLPSLVFPLGNPGSLSQPGTLLLPAALPSACLPAPPSALHATTAVRAPFVGLEPSGILVQQQQQRREREWEQEDPHAAASNADLL